MASTPSASALSAVLRCRHNIWTSPSTRLTGTTAAARDPNAKPAWFWDVLTLEERLVVGRLALTCNAPVKNKKRAEKVCHRLSQPWHAHGTSHARKPASPAPCKRFILQASKVVFVCESSSLKLCTRGVDTADDHRKRAWLWVSVGSSCVFVSARLTRLMLDRILVLFKAHSNQDGDELSRQSNDLEISGQTDMKSDNGSLCASCSDATVFQKEITKHRPD